MHVNPVPRLLGAPVIARGPYRFVRHPNYWMVTAEIAVLPLVFGAWPVAVVWSVLNALLLHHRIRVEDQALSPRRRRWSRGRQAVAH
jgi:methyltransferase